MASKRRIRRSQCTGKRRFSNDVVANRRLAELKAAGKIRGMCHVYHCKFCHGYHFGHMDGEAKRGLYNATH